MFKGISPYIGKVGPLIAGGNTEVFSHDALNGMAAPAMFKVDLIDPRGMTERFNVYCDFDPWSK